MLQLRRRRSVGPRPPSQSPPPPPPSLPFPGVAPRSPSPRGGWRLGVVGAVLPPQLLGRPPGRRSTNPPLRLLVASSTRRRSTRSPRPPGRRRRRASSEPCAPWCTSGAQGRRGRRVSRQGGTRRDSGGPAGTVLHGSSSSRRAVLILEMLRPSCLCSVGGSGLYWL